MAGTTVLVSPYLLHRDPARWRAAAAFRPERWADALAQRGGAAAALSGLGPNGAYVPFGAGPRNCIGTGARILQLLSCMFIDCNLCLWGYLGPWARAARWGAGLWTCFGTGACLTCGKGISWGCLGSF